MKKIIVYQAVHEDLTHLGGPMGSEYTTDSPLGLFATPDRAKEECDKNYKKFPAHKGKLKWLKEEKGFRTEDLGFVMYHVKPVEIK